LAFQTPWPQCTRLASLSANNQVLQIAKNGKEILIYSIAKQEEEEEVADLAHEHFYSSSPMREIFLFDYVTKDEFFACTRARLQKCFQHPRSKLITVREKSTGRLVAFQAITIREKNDGSEVSVDPEDRSTGWLLRAIIAKLDEGVDLYALYQTDRILHIWFTVVSGDYRGQRLVGVRNATICALFAKIAHDNKIGAMRAEPSSQYSSPEECWKIIQKIHFETFQLPDGTRPFDGIDFGVHRGTRLVACRPPPLIHFLQHSDAIAINNLIAESKI